ncbi:S-methyl-5-thioribose-1-phosphate isomerase [Micromonospora sp. DR5-3]|uniref:S-methyl-5-thioribose-1-phosphate isomerase n=1 Tax=unclassified Micromonospora TaxID=2617518 RepID=UPI002105A19B|nr:MULTISPECIES: S-methyl-5-thioribose-1-phosphate isomerase [unclassified Micromonospora]MCW3819856.1 S-methyl-5-thioribose-1-phosphate isomerase [Micromonospora sp. DR5-3]
MMRSIAWQDGAIEAVDQCALPHEYRLLRLSTPDEVIEAIQRLAIRGAPAIGVAGALAVAMSARAHTRDGVCDEIAVRADARRIANARPTAVNLSWAVRRVVDKLGGGADAVQAEALAILTEDEQRNRAAAEAAAGLVRRLCGQKPLRLLTHCNTGRLATVAWGTALGAIRVLAGTGHVAEVLFGETRPLLQGARLTAWELAEAGIPHRMLVDSAGPAALASGMVDCVLVGADRVCANGDVANKIGTYSLALAAHRAGVPFIVVAPESTLDAALTSGADIVIEERAAGEVTAFGGVEVAPAGTEVFNPAFDVTPAELVTAVVTELGLVRPLRATLPRPAARERVS